MNVILLEVGRHLFGVDAARISQVVDPPPVTPVPFLPEHVEGLVNIGGSVVASINLGAALGMPAADGSGVTMVVRAAQGAFALKVGRVLMMVPVDEDALHPVSTPPEEAGAAHGMVAAEFGWNDRMVLLIDPDRFDFGDIDLDEHLGGAEVFAAVGDAASTAAAEGRSDGQPFLLVELGGERYALDVHAVVEVLEADEFVCVPKAPAEVLGYYSLRGTPLLVVSLSMLLAVAPSAVGHVVVVERQGVRLGLGVSRVAGIRTFDPHAADDVADASGAVAGCLVDAGGAMLAALDLDHVLTPAELSRLAEYLPKIDTQHHDTRAGSDRVRRLLTFWLGDELCGIDLEAVSRVAECQHWTGLPGDALGLSGVTQIGDEVMPVVDLRRRRGAEAGSQPPAQVVAHVGGGCCALAVDRTHRIINVPVDEIRPVEDASNDMLIAVGRAEDRLVSVLSVEHLLEARA